MHQQNRFYCKDGFVYPLSATAQTVFLHSNEAIEEVELTASRATKCTIGVILQPEFNIPEWSADIPSRIMYAFLSSFMNATGPVCLQVLDSITGLLDFSHNIRRHNYVGVLEDYFTDTLRITFH